MINANILEAAKLISSIDPSLSELFITQPFKRMTVITVFHKSLSECYLAPLADQICMSLRSAVDSAQ